MTLEKQKHEWNNILLLLKMKIHSCDIGILYYFSQLIGAFSLVFLFNVNS